MKTNFSIQFLDHVAIRVENMEASAKWYEQVLGLKICKLPKWDPFPIFLLAGKTGIALFPAHSDDPALDQKSLNIKIDHFAFNVTNAGFKKALEHFAALEIDFEVKDHFYFHSVYIRDLDGHQVELTTQMVDVF